MMPLPRGLLYVGARLNLDIYDADGMLIHPAGVPLFDEAEIEALWADGPMVRTDSLEMLRQSRWGHENAHRFDAPQHPAALAVLRRERGTRPRKAVTAQMLGSYLAQSRHDVNDHLYSLTATLRVALADPLAADFKLRLAAVTESVQRLMREDPDRTLLVLIHEAARTVTDYSVRHSLLVACITGLACREAEPDVPEASAVQAALLMNVAITDLQNHLADADQRPSDAEAEQIRDHPRLGLEVLRLAGIRDDLVLGAVSDHHEPLPEGQAYVRQPPARRLSLLIQAADIFMSRQSRRSSRRAMSAFMAAKCFFDGQTIRDEAAAIVLRAIGIFPPGVIVRLSSMEIAVVVARGRTATTPVVASVMDSAGHVPQRPVLRSVDGRLLRILEASIPADVNVNPSLAALLSLRPGRDSGARFVKPKEPTPP